MWKRILCLIAVTLLLTGTAAAAGRGTSLQIADTAEYYNGSAYMLFSQSATWEKAQEYCSSLGGHLATISDAREMDFITNYLNRQPGTKRCYWIGLKWDGAAQNWSWVTDEPFVYANWAANEPTDTDEDYVHLFGQAYTGGNGTKYVGEWNNADNDGASYAGDYYKLENFGYICEWDLISPEDGLCYGGSIYHIYRDLDSWQNAKIYCQSRNGHLVTISSQDEQDALLQYTQSMMPGDAHFWIGLQSGWTQWINGEPVRYTNWGDNEPDGYVVDGHPQCYAAMCNAEEDGNVTGVPWHATPGQWDDKAESELCYYICEWDTALPMNMLYYNGSVYGIYTDLMSWQEANAFCDSLYGHLVTITSREEQDILIGHTQSILPTDAHFWIGLQSDWTQWINGEPVRYTNWGDNEPDGYVVDGHPQCYAAMCNAEEGGNVTGVPWHVYPGQWDDKAESERCYFICEWDDLPLPYYNF